MMRKRKVQLQKKGSGFSLQNWVGLAMMFLTVGYFLRMCYRNEAENSALAKDAQRVKAVIIDRKNYFGNSPVSRQFAYSYRFNAGGRAYEGNSRDPDLHVGDSVLIEYASSNPYYNRVVEGGRAGKQ